MKSTGEVMAIGGGISKEAFLKAWASLEVGKPHPRPLMMPILQEASLWMIGLQELPTAILEDWLRVPTDRRMSAIMEALKRVFARGCQDLTGGVTRVVLTDLRKWVLLLRPRD